MAQEQQKQDNEKIIWVMGNRQSVIIPMEQEIIPAQGDPYTEDFYPAEDDVVKVTLTGAYRPYIYTPEVDGHLLILTDNGTLPKGLYGVQITVVGANGETRLRSFWDQQIVVTEKNNSVMKEWDEFKDQPVTARAAVFFFAKGDKGDALTWDDLTPEQKASLKGEKGDKGDKGDALTWDDLTEEQKASLKGEKGDKGDKGDKGNDGASGGMLFPKMDFNAEDGILTITGLKQEVERISYDEENGVLTITL